MTQATPESAVPQPPVVAVVDGIPTGWLWVIGLGWYLCTTIMLGVALGADRVLGVGEGSLGGDVVASGVSGRATALPVLLALGLGILGVLVVLGHGWALLPLVVLGGVEVLGLSVVGNWLAVGAMVGLVLGAAPALLPSVQRHLWAGALHGGRR